MTEHDTLLQGVLDKPDDDFPRLAYADWLDEAGLPERAEIIRIQIALHRIPLSERTERNPAALPLLAREKYLTQQYLKQWLEPFRKRGQPLMSLSTHGQFRRGFLEVVWMPATEFLKRGHRLFEVAPVVELRITRARDRELLDVVSSPLLERLKTLDLSLLPLGDREAMRLAESPFVVNLQLLRMVQCRVSELGAAALAASPYLSKSVDIDLKWNPCWRYGQDPIRQAMQNRVVSGQG